MKHLRLGPDSPPCYLLHTPVLSAATECAREMLSCRKFEEKECLIIYIASNMRRCVW